MFTIAQKMRLRELLAKAEADRSEDEAKELKTLTALAKEADYDATADDPELEGGLDEDAVKALVATAVGDTFTNIGLDEDTVKAIKESLENGDGAPDAEAIQKAVKEVLGDGTVDYKKLAEQVKAALPKESLTEEKVKSLFKSFKEDIEKGQRRQSKMAFGGAVGSPIEHRSGNLTVAQKQLLNKCLSTVSESALAQSDGGRGIERPKSINDGIPEDVLASAQANGKALVKSLTTGRKDITTDTLGAGAELVNVDLSSDLQQRMYLESEVARMLVDSEIDMPTATFKFPLSTTRPTFYRGTEAPASAVTASNPGTSEIILNAKKLIGWSEYSYESDEDAIIAILPWLQRQLGESAAESLEDAFINGDDTGVHQDSDVTASNDHRKLFKGFRYYANQVAGLKVDFAASGITTAGIADLRKALGRFGVKRVGDLMIIAGVKGYNELVQLTETLTVDKVGPGNARILTGNAPQIFGIPIVVSDKVREDLNDSGVYDGATTTEGSILMVHKPSYIVGVKREMLVETDRNVFTQMNQVVASFRRDFVPKETPSATEPTVSMGYSYTS